MAIPKDVKGFGMPLGRPVWGLSDDDQPRRSVIFGAHHQREAL